MPYSGCPALHGVNPYLKKKRFKGYTTPRGYITVIKSLQSKLVFTVLTLSVSQEYNDNKLFEIMLHLIIYMVHFGE